MRAAFSATLPRSVWGKPLLPSVRIHDHIRLQVLRSMHNGTGGLTFSVFFSQSTFSRRKPERKASQSGSISSGEGDGVVRICPSHLYMQSYMKDTSPRT